MHTVHKGDLLHAGKVGSALVCQQHEFLDHGFTLAGGALFHVDAVAVLVQDQLHLAALDIHAAALLTQTGTVAVQLLHGRQLRQYLMVLAGQLIVSVTGKQGVDLGIHALDPAANDGLNKAVVGQVAVLIQPHQTGEGQSQHALVQTADTVGQLLGQHGHHLIGVVDAGSAVKGLVVQLGAGLDVVGNIRNVHAQLKAAVRGLGQTDSIVDVLGLSAVDGKDGQGAQIHTALAVRSGHLGVVQLFGLVPHLVWEAAADILRVEQCLCAALSLVAAAKAHGHAYAVILLTVAAQQNLHCNLVAVLGTTFAVPHDLHRDGGAIVRHKLQAALHAVHGAHQSVLLFQNSKDLAFITALYPGMCKLFHQHLVAGHCAAGKPAGDKDIAGAVLQHDEGKILAQLYHLAQQCLVGTAAAHGEEHALPLADDGLVHQLVHSLHHLAVCAAIPAELILQILYGARLILDRVLNFIAHCHKIFSPSLPWPCISCGAQPCLGTGTFPLSPLCGSPQNRLPTLFSAQKNSPVRSRGCNAFSACQTACKQASQNSDHKEHHACNAGDLGQHLVCRGQTCIVGTAHAAVDGTRQTLTVGVLHEGEENDDQRSHQQNGTANNFDNRHES